MIMADENNLTQKYYNSTQRTHAKMLEIYFRPNESESPPNEKAIDQQ